MFDSYLFYFLPSSLNPNIHLFFFLTYSILCASSILIFSASHFGFWLHFLFEFVFFPASKAICADGSVIILQLNNIIAVLVL